VGVLAEKLGEEVISSERNKISLAMTLRKLKGDPKEFGAWLFNLGIMGARICVRTEK